MHTQWEAVILTLDLEWRHSLARLLHANGIDATYATNIEECRQIAKRQCLDLIFWDNHLTNPSGQGLASSVGRLDHEVRIVIVSRSDELLRPTARAEAFAVIPFPGQPTDIEWVLSRAVRAEFQGRMADRHRELQPYW